MTEELYRSTSRYHDITVNDEDGSITLRFGGRKQSALDPDSGLSAKQPVLDYLHLPVAIATDPRRALLIGLGGGVLAKRMLHDYPEMHIDAVEIDPEVVDVARRFFGLPDDDRLRITVANGRTYLEQTARTYDVIVIDAYFEALTPYELVTEEFLKSAARRLASGGALAYNVVAVLSGRGSRPFHRFLKTVGTEFPAVYVFPVGTSCGGNRQNIVVVATPGPVEMERTRIRIRSRGDGLVRVDGLREMAEGMLRVSVARGTRTLRDSDAPAGGMFHT